MLVFSTNNVVFVLWCRDVIEMVWNAFECKCNANKCRPNMCTLGISIHRRKQNRYKPVKWKEENWREINKYQNIDMASHSSIESHFKRIDIFILFHQHSAWLLLLYCVYSIDESIFIVIMSMCVSV